MRSATTTFGEPELTATDGMHDGSPYCIHPRRAADAGPAVLAVRDTSGRVFGAFTAEPWRIAPRYYGTGESFVFQLRVRAPASMRMLWLLQCSLPSALRCMMRQRALVHAASAAG